MWRDNKYKRHKYVEHVLSQCLVVDTLRIYSTIQFSGVERYWLARAIIICHTCERLLFISQLFVILVWFSGIFGFQIRIQVKIGFK